MDRWKQAAHAIGVVQARIFMFAIYASLALPLGLLFRLASDPLHLCQPPQTNWTPCHPEPPSLDRARQQF